MAEILDRYENFELTEETIKAIHKNLMGSELSWNGNFKPELVDNYRNYQVIGYREPFYRNREYKLMQDKLDQCWINPKNCGAIKYFFRTNTSE